MKRGKRGGWKRGREWGLHQCQFVETHKLPTFKHLHLKGEHIYIYITYPKIKKNEKQTSLAELKPRNTTKTPPQTKKICREFNFPFSRLETWLPSVVCLADSGWHGVRKARRVSQIPSRGKGQALLGRGSGSTWLLGRRSDLTLPAPELHGTRWRRQRWVSKVHRARRTGMWLQQGARTLCFSRGYTSRAKERERRSPVGKRSWLSPHLGKWKQCPKLSQTRKRADADCGHGEKEDKGVQ